MSTDDYTRFVSKDIDQAPRMTATGTAPAMLANKVSWFFNLRGPSLLIDTACSSSLVALDLACQYIQNGYATTVSLKLLLTVLILLTLGLIQRRL